MHLTHTCNQLHSDDAVTGQYLQLIAKIKAPLESGDFGRYLETGMIITVDSEFVKDSCDVEAPVGLEPTNR